MGLGRQQGDRRDGEGGSGECEDGVGDVLDEDLAALVGERLVERSRLLTELDRILITQGNNDASLLCGGQDEIS